MNPTRANRSNKRRQVRARSDDAKEHRRRAILVAAGRLFEQGDYEAVTVAAVARASGLAKGTVYLYFPSKESIFLDLLLGELEDWLASLSGPLARVPREDARALARLIAASLGRRPALRRLLALLHVTLEKNVDHATVRDFKRRSAGAMGPTADRLEERMPHLGRGGGLRLLLQLHALVVGVGQVSDESDVVKEVLAERALAPFRVKFEGELRELLELLLIGGAARARRRP